MAVTVVPLEHFSGQRAIEKNPGGSDTRDLRGILNEVITQANTNETNITGLGTPFDFQGAITLPADFPTSALVETGWTYIFAADVIDNDGTRTNTGQSFKAGDEAVWNGTGWTRLGRQVTQLKAGDNLAVAATATSYQFMATRGGKIQGVSAIAGTTAAAGEDTAVDVQIGGVSCLTSAIDVDNAAGTTLQTGTIDTAANSFVAGDIIQIVRTYTAGGGPTPMANVAVGIDYEETLAS